MPSVDENPSRLLGTGPVDESSIKTNTDPGFAERFRAFQEPLKPPPPLTLKEVWEITIGLIRQARALRKAKTSSAVTDTPASPTLS
jgi:hypothetical protein